MKFNFKEEKFYIPLSAFIAFVWTYFVSFKSPIVVDYGVLLDRTWRIFMGEVPGKDFYCPTTPLTFLIQALLFKIFSPAVLWMKIYVALQMALLTVLAALFAKRVLKLSETIIILVVLPLTIVWLPGIHLMKPWYDVDAIFFSYVALFFMGLYYSEETRGKTSWMILSGVMAGLSYLSKQNIGGGCFIAAFLFFIVQTYDLKTKFKQGLWFLLGIGLSFSAIALYFLINGGLSEAWSWMMVRAGQRYGEGQLVSAMWQSNNEALFGPRNHFLKFLLPFYLYAIVFAFRNRKSLGSLGPIFLGTTLYCLVAMWIGNLQEGGKRYISQQVYLGLVGGTLILSLKTLKYNKVFQMAFKTVMILAILLMVYWGGTKWWRQTYDSSAIKYTIDTPKMKGLYLRQEDYDLVQGLLEFEKKIPKDEKIFIMPDPLFFYYATDRMSPVPMTHFLVSGWELNWEEQKLIPEMLENENVQWIFIGQEQYFDTGFIRFGLPENWKEAIEKNTAMMSRSDYAEVRQKIDQRFREVPGPKGFWTLRKTK